MFTFWSMPAVSKPASNRTRIFHFSKFAIRRRVVFSGPNFKSSSLVSALLKLYASGLPNKMIKNYQFTNEYGILNMPLRWSLPESGIILTKMKIEFLPLKFVHEA